MDEQEKTNPKGNIIQYFLIVTAAVFVLNTIFKSLIYRYLVLSIANFGSFELLINLPIIRNIYWSITEPLYYYYATAGSVYYIMPYINLVIGLGLNYMIAYMIVNKNSSNNNETTSSATVLTVTNIVKNSFIIAQNNIAIILTASLLWILTIWIPYLNVGTTIGMWALVVGLSKKDTTFSATSIFESKYRKYIGEVFLLLGFIMLGMSIGYIFFIIPGLVISFAWGQSIYLLIDKELTPLQAIKASNDITYGEKFTIFLGYILLILILGIVIGLIGLLVSFIGDPWLLILFSFLTNILSFVIMISAAIYIYGELSNKLTK